MTVIGTIIFTVVAIVVGGAVGIAMMTCLFITIDSWRDPHESLLVCMMSLIWVPVLVCFITGIVVLINVINSFEYNLMSYIKVGFSIGFFGISIYFLLTFSTRKNNK